MPSPKLWELVQAQVEAYRVIDKDGDFEVRECGCFHVRIDPDRAVQLLQSAGWQILRVVKMEWLKELKAERVNSSSYVSLDEGDNLVGIYIKEKPAVEEREWQGKKKKQYLFKVHWLVSPKGERHDFSEPKNLRASVKLAGDIAEAIEDKLFELTGGTGDPEKIPEVLPIKIKREGQGIGTRYKVG